MDRSTQRFSDQPEKAFTSARNTANIILGKDLVSYTLLFINPAENYATGSHIQLQNQNVQIGRSSECHIRYGENYTMVSRNQCSIICEKGSVFLHPNPAATNPTLIEGVEITFVHELRNGDEIQFSYGGPKLRFNKTESDISKLGVTGRINIALKQATAPLRALIIILAVLVVLIGAMASFALYQVAVQSGLQREYQQQIQLLEQERISLEQELKKLSETKNVPKSDVKRINNRIQTIDSEINNIQRKASKKKSILPFQSEESKNIDEKEISEKPGSSENEEPPAKSSPIEKPIEEFEFPESDIFFIKATEIVLAKPGMPAKVFTQDDLMAKKIIPHKMEGLWSGTGLLTADQKLITGRHVIQPWRFQLESSKLIKWLGVLEADNILISVQFSAENLADASKNFTFKSEDVKLPATTDGRESVSVKSTTLGGVKLSSTNLQVYKANDPTSDIAAIEAPHTGQSRSKEISEVSPLMRVVVFTHQYQLTDKPKSKGLLAGPDKTYIQRFQNLTLHKNDMRSRTKGKSKQCLFLDKTPQMASSSTGGPAFALIEDQAYFIGVLPLGHACITPYTRL